MDVSFASTAAVPGHPNEDLVLAAGNFVIVLDGVTSPPHVPTGCRHDPVWLVRTLAAALAANLLHDTGPDLRSILENAICAVRDQHAHTCDLTHPESPSSTVAVLRERDEHVDYLVLCDSTLVLTDRAGRISRTVTDDRTTAMRGLTRAAVAERRNQPGGFWVASTDPAAAGEALTGTVGTDTVSSALVCTDGVSRLVDAYGWNWSELVEHEPRDLVRLVRAAETRSGPPAGSRKQHDDATVARCRYPVGAAGGAPR